MKAMILAAGRGNRLRPLTDTIPKPLIDIGGISLIERHILQLREAGIREIVINLAYLGYLIQEKLQDGSKYGVYIEYSQEPQDGGLETAGGIRTARDLLGDYFIVINADVLTDFDFSLLTHELQEGSFFYQFVENSQENKSMTSSFLAHLILVENPPFKEVGDFVLGEKITLNTSFDPINQKFPSQMRSSSSQETEENFTLDKLSKVHYLNKVLKDTGNCDNIVKTYTFSGIALYRKEFFDSLEKMQRYPLLPLFQEFIDKKAISAQLYQGTWKDVGTIERLQDARKWYQQYLEKK